MGWRCVNVRRRLPLFAGDDLPEQEKESVELHLNKCANCRDRLASLRESRDFIQQYASVPAEPDTSPSLWPSIRNQLAHRYYARRPRRALLPVSAVAAASIAIGVVLWNRPVHLESFGDRTSRSAIHTVDSMDHAFFGDRVSRLKPETVFGSPAWEEGSRRVTPYYQLDSSHPLGLVPGEL
jgi:hypothetical protein